ncbi:MAG: hypothetical protein E7646_09950 [Ruminococcaceae bacterium]|nr:hypothetical protein [Oscillospiraceae bacterium]
MPCSKEKRVATDPQNTAPIRPFYLCKQVEAGARSSASQASTQSIFSLRTSVFSERGRIE